MVGFFFFAVSPAAEITQTAELKTKQAFTPEPLSLQLQHRLFSDRVTVSACTESRVFPPRCEGVFTCSGRDLRTVLLLLAQILLRWFRVSREDSHFTGKPNSESGRGTLRPNCISGPEGRLLQASACTKGPCAKWHLCKLLYNCFGSAWVYPSDVARSDSNVCIQVKVVKGRQRCPRRQLPRSSEWKEILITCICLIG